MNRLAEAMERRCASKREGAAVRLLMKGGTELVRMYKEHVLQGLIDAAVGKHLGKPRLNEAKGMLTPWTCARCGPRLGTELRRNGHYQRQPLTTEGPITLRIPQLLCRGCNKSVPFKHPLLPRRARLWLDMEQRIAELYLEGCSYRATRRVLERECRSSMGLMSIWRAFQRVGQRPHAPAARPPAKYLGMDEVYQKVQGEKRWLLSLRAQDAEGKKHWVGSVVSSERSKEAWETALVELGVSRYNPPFAVITDGDQGLDAAIAQALPGVKVIRCVWHIKHNAWEWITSRYSRAEDASQREELMAAVHAIVDAPTLEQRRQALNAIRLRYHWLAEQLGQVLERIPPKDADHPIRTNNLMERGFRDYRRRTRPMDGFGSDKGLSNFHLLWMLKENARVNGRDYLAEILP